MIPSNTAGSFANELAITAGHQRTNSFGTRQVSRNYWVLTYHIAQLIPGSKQMDDHVHIPQWHLSLERQLREQQALLQKLTSMVGEQQDDLQRLKPLKFQVQEQQEELQRLQPLPQQVERLKDDIKDLEKENTEMSEKLEVVNVKVNSGTCTSPLTGYALSSLKSECHELIESWLCWGS